MDHILFPLLLVGALLCVVAAGWQAGRRVSALVVLVAGGFGIYALTADFQASLAAEERNSTINPSEYP